MDDVRLRVALVEDHGPLREILLEYIADLPEVSSCHAYSNAESALATFFDGTEDPPPDLILVDLSLPGMNGIELIRELRAVHPQICCAILSGHRSAAYAGQALAAGAMGYILKGDPQEISRGIDAVVHGQRFVSRAVTEPN
jgi:DNA-binding NarL/FixJ family response regulator